MKAKYTIAIIVALIIIATVTIIFITNNQIFYNISDALSEPNSQNLRKEVKLRGKVTELDATVFGLSDENGNVIRVTYYDDFNLFNDFYLTGYQSKPFDSNKIKPFPEIENGDIVIVKGFLTTQGWQAASLNPPIKKLIIAYSVKEIS